MKNFLVKISVYVSAIIILHLILGSYADGNTDDNYRHFTSQANNIILGDSRGAQAVNPYVLDKKFSGRSFDNFSLNIVNSPYGEIYYHALKRKINPDTKDGIFIFTVNPWNLSLPKNVTSKEDFPEEKSPLKDVYLYHYNPNYEYLIKHYKRSWFHIYRDREAVGKSKAYLHKNGWMEVTVDIHPDSVKMREKSKYDDYLIKSRSVTISEIRFEALGKMIDFLKDKGEIYIVRLPASEKIMNLESKTFPNFDSKMSAFSKNKKVTYFDFSKNFKNYIYTDGNHMYKNSGSLLTKQLSDSIKKYQ